MMMTQQTIMQSNKQHSIVGRFAPSPTGPLHFGSLVAAVGSYLPARKAQGRWLLRIEDLDPPRVIPGAADAMLLLLEKLGFEWDGQVVYQSQRTERYRQILQQLDEQNLVFACSCSRREILASAPHTGEEGPVYPGTCRKGPIGNRPERAIRLQVPDEVVSYSDGVFGRQSQNLQRAVGDFTLCRADGLFAYQLAVVVDDLDSGVTQVVRGADLLSSTPRQIFLYRCLQQAAIEYCHLPLALGNNAKKLSKRHGSFGLITSENGGRAIWQALNFLGQNPPAAIKDASPAELLAWGEGSFCVDRVPTAARSVPEF